MGYLGGIINSGKLVMLEVQFIVETLLPFLSS